MIEKYTESVEIQMQSFYKRLPEKAQRHYAALEAQKFSYGGKAYIIRLFGIHHKTLNKGIAELTNPELYTTVPVNKQRRSGGGRKKNRAKESEFTGAITQLDRPT
jgi:hypothetical protein